MYSNSSYLWMPFFGAILFAASSIAYKIAFSKGATVSQAFLANNLILSLFFLPMFLMEGRSIPLSKLVYPLIVGSCFFAANVLNFRALSLGDVSLVTPLMGTKVLFVALFASLFFGLKLLPGQWLAAFLTALGIFMLGVTEKRSKSWIGRATLYALASSASFAVCDLFMQKWAGSFGPTQFLPIMFLWVAFLSTTTVLVQSSLKGVQWKVAGRWVLLGAILMGLQATLIATSISFFSDATGVNVVYSLRGIWGLFLVWLMGERMASLESVRHHPWILWTRVGGSVLILVAVFLAIRAAGEKVH